MQRRSVINLIMTKARINKAIKHLGLEIQNKRGDGYSYFTDMEGNQVGDSVYVCYMSQLSLAQWVGEATRAKAQGRL